MSELGPVIAVVGPSGVGKDSLMLALAQAEPRLSLLKRVITRTPDAGGEEYQAVSEAVFQDLQETGAFALHWQAHGLYYGLPAADLQRQRCEGGGVLVNFSRAVLLEAQALFDPFVVFSVTATPDVLAARLKMRDRETKSEQLLRLARATKPLPDGLLQVIEIDNSGSLDAAVMAAQHALYPPRG
ncbi:phosphonate metabolism protein/1,5-bisphosphokinase (PRPP-forming) PhnN [Epibacterium ulvae]|nr:phosphonate metabolism protein/1,5-bisphosphokinase (PRPP-forming) PhnN [Epibacterium ulvae]